MSAREFRSALAQAFAGAERRLWLGDRRHAPEGAQVLRDVQELAASSERTQGALASETGCFDAIGWVTRGPLRQGLSLLRPRLTDGGLLWILLDDAPLLGAVSRALRLSSNSDEALIEACEALLLSGYREPRVLTALRPRLVLAANKPRRGAALDAFFEQPPA